MKNKKIVIAAAGLAGLGVALWAASVANRRPLPLQGGQKGQWNYNDLARDLLRAAQSNENHKGLVELLATADAQDLFAQLDTTEKHLAFWMNLYNAYVLLVLKREPGLYDEKTNYFTRKRIYVARQPLSLDDIEHGILRGGKHKYGLGYLGQAFPGRFLSTFKAERPDPRVHFALNCGANSCPPIILFDHRSLHDQLDWAMRAFLQAQSHYDPQANTLETSRILLWFLGDFGGKSGILRLLKDLAILPEEAQPQVNFARYDWRMNLSNFRSFEEGDFAKSPSL